MKKILLIIFLLLIYNARTFSQNYWEQTSIPSSGCNVYALYSCSDGSIMAGTNNGIYRSTDDCENWTNIGLKTTNVRCISLNSLGNIYIVADSGLFVSDNNGQSWSCIYQSTLINCLGINNNDQIFIGIGFDLYRSIDKGETFSKIYTTVGVTQVITSIIFTSSNDIFIGTTWYYGLDLSVYKSTDNGNSWNATGVYGNVYKLIKNKNGDIYAGTPEGLFESTDNGNSWNRISEIADIYNIEVNSGNLLFINKYNGLYMTQDDGKDWTLLNSFLKHNFVTSILANNSNELVVGTIKGIFLSSDNGKTWMRKNNGFNYSIVTSLILSPNDTIYTVLNGNEIFESGDNGETWMQIDSIGSNYSINNILINNRGDLLISTNQGIYCKKKNSNSWTLSGFKDVLINPFAKDPIGILYAVDNSSKNMYCSTDNGDSWNQVNYPYNYFSGFSVLSVNTITFSSKGDIYVGCNGGGIQYSSDKATSWYPETDPLNGGNEKYLFIDTSNNYLWAGNDVDGIFKEVIGGWQKVENGLNGNIINDLIFVSQNKLFASTNEGIYTSSDYGDNWMELNNGLNNLATCPIVKNSNGILFVGTNGNGIFRSIESITSIKKGRYKLNQYFLYPNFPNPFNPVTTIQYQIPKNEFVTLKVYNILGQFVKTLVNDRKAAGFYSLRFDGSKLSSGAYLYILQAGSFRNVKKFVLLK